jgi:hypothetical protein
MMRIWKVTGAIIAVAVIGKFVEVLWQLNL